MATGDIVVKRIAGANVQEANLLGVASIAVVGRSLGKPTSDVAIGARAAGDLDNFVTDFIATPFKDKLRSIGTIVSPDASYEGEVYYPNIQFVVKSNLSGSYLLVDSKNLGENEHPANLELDWSVAPALVAPAIVQTSVVLQNHTSGFVTSGTYFYAVAAVDHSAVISTPGPRQQVDVPTATGGKSYKVLLTWKMAQFSTGYKVYRGTQSDGSDLALIGTISSKTSVSLSDNNLTASTAPVATNLTKQKPANLAVLWASYVYGLLEVNTIKTYTSYEQVLNDHGLGSELANVGKLILHPSYNNAPVMVTVVPQSEDQAGYISALQVLESAEVQFVCVLYQGASGVTAWVANQTSVYQHCASLSDEEAGQKERYAILALPWVAGRSVYDAKEAAEAYQNTATKGKRGHLVYPDGGRAQVLLWDNVDGTTESYYEKTDPDGYSLTELYFAVAALARYTGLRDTAEPPTEKDVIGFYLPETPGTTTEINLLRNASVFTIENRGGISVISRGINMSLSSLSLEDGEVNIAVTEDYMKGDLRRVMRKYRGRKMIGAIMRAAKRTLDQRLAQFVSNELIAYYDPSSITVVQDPIQKDKLHGFFKYMPIYPVNNVEVEYDFTFVVL